MSQTALRALVDLRDRTLQKQRIAFGNRLAAAERGDDEMSPEEYKLIQDWYAKFAELEQEADAEIALLAADVEIVQMMTAVKGVGYTLAAKIVSLIDIERADTVSALWRYAGYGVQPDGTCDRPVKGETLCYNARLKTTLHILAQSFLRSHSPYAEIYYNAREFYAANRPDWTKGHQHLASMRKMIKVFLAHLWEVWRTMENLPTRSLYVMEQLGHTHYIQPEEMGWEAVSRDFVAEPVYQTPE